MIPKCRAWDKEKKWMYIVLAVDFDNKYITVSDSQSSDDLRTLGFDEVALMQSIGLKDSKGKEIFEGDIIKIPRYKQKFSILEVKNISHYGVFLTYKYPYTGGIFWGDLNRRDETEIIGNIFENPEMMEMGK